MRLFIDIIRKVSERLEAKDIPGEDELELGGIAAAAAAAAVFHEHCRQNSEPFHYQTSKKVEKSRRDF